MSQKKFPKFGHFDGQSFFQNKGPFLQEADFWVDNAILVIAGENINLGFGKFVVKN